MWSEWRAGTANKKQISARWAMARRFRWAMGIRMERRCRRRRRG